MKLPRFELDHWFAVAEGRFDLSLSHSACEIQCAADVLDNAELKAFAEIPLGYGPFDGLPELQRAIARQYESIEPANVLTFNGPSEAIYTFMQATLEAGNQVVVQSPLFHTLHAIARQIGCEIKEWQPTDELSCEFDVASLAAVCSSSTKAIIINFPHNPTGQMISERALRQIVDIANSVDAILFSDEVFRLLELPPQATLPAVCDLYDKGVSISGMSKPFGLGGLRIGWMATQREDIRQAAKEYRYYTAEMTNTPCQWLACRALERKDDVLARNLALIAANLKRLESFVESHSDTLRLFRPKAGTMAVVEQRTAMTSTELCERMLDEERVFLVPGKPLGMSDRLLRIGLGRSDLEAGLARFDRFLNRLAESGETQ
ncbi:MAG: aminotransferase class I/II-fold pyridoxal phosphate-dependent enzyme [Planctomycetes bacterium]|nr:aminotransferase class I/II-fold pyridoxal phosphate-dependent enzyme [Planctomycetota bacterium]